MRNFYKLPEAKQHLLNNYYLKKQKQEFERKRDEKNKRKELLKDLKGEADSSDCKSENWPFVNVLPSPNYLSSQHEDEDDPVRNALEDNDCLYEEINYMQPYPNI